MNEFAGKDFAGDDVRDGMVGAVAVKIQDPVFETQTKNKLGNTEIAAAGSPRSVKEQVILWLHRNTEAAEALLEKVAARTSAPQGAAASIKKQARERAQDGRDPHPAS